MLIQAPKGTRDILPSDINKWQQLEQKFFRAAENFGFKEIRTPVFEYTDIFTRGVGDTTDIVQKEMYTFEDKAGRSITLRPEGTAGIVRSYIENGMSSMPSPIKLAYNIAAYRYENVAKGRYREFNQFGVEAFGSKGPLIDAEIITLAEAFFNEVGIKQYRIEINSIGCSDCRPKYNNELKKYFQPNIGEMCSACQNRLDTNPLRILDCKESKCQKYLKDAPVILEYLCDDCKEHFDALKSYLDNLSVDYIVNGRIVRGLDYYTKTVFEFVSDNVGTQGTICAGGRYDDLVSTFNGKDVPGVGFALGVERLLMQAEAENIFLDRGKDPLIYIASIGDDAKKFASKLSCGLRAAGIYSENDSIGRSLKAQMKYANKINSGYVMVIGDDEILKNKASLKNMKTGDEKEVEIDGMINELYKLEEKNAGDS